MKQLFILITFILSFSSCATILDGQVDKCQTTKPVPGEPQRQIRAGFMVADILLFPIGLAVDFGTGAIYKRCQTENNNKKFKLSDPVYGG